jgi:predicted PurR-regulated permease PerM
MGVRATAYVLTAIKENRLASRSTRAPNISSTLSKTSYSVVALAALAFLIVIHKLEYFFSARLLGARIQAFAWELLIALAMETLFGMAGLLAAPVYYAYLKRELREESLI